MNEFMAGKYDEYKTIVKEILFPVPRG